MNCKAVPYSGCWYRSPHTHRIRSPDTRKYLQVLFNKKQDKLCWLSCTGQDWAHLLTSHLFSCPFYPFISLLYHTSSSQTTLIFPFPQVWFICSTSPNKCCRIPKYFYHVSYNVSHIYIGSNTPSFKRCSRELLQMIQAAPAHGAGGSTETAPEGNRLGLVSLAGFFGFPICCPAPLLFPVHGGAFDRLLAVL